MSKKWKSTIGAKSSLINLNIREIYEYRDLCFIFVRKNYITKYKQTIFGPLYMILAPLLTSGVFSLVFGAIAGLGTNGIPNFLFYFSGNMAWGFFSSCCFENNNIFGNNAYIMGKVYFPRMIIPISNIITKLINVLVNLLMLFAFFTIFMIKGSELSYSWRMVLAPFIMLVLGIMGLSIGLIISSLTIKYRDLNVILGFLMNLMFYASPVIYPLSNLSGAMFKLALLNPVAPLLEAFRYTLFGTGVIAVPYIIWSVGFTLAILFIGLVLFNHVEKTFVDTI